MLALLAFALLSTASARAAGCAPSASDAYSGAVLADGPLAYFRNDEAGGSSLCDSAAPPHEGSYFGGVSFGTTGALADGNPAVTATAGVGTAGPGVSGNHDFTLEGWFRRTSTTQNQALVAMGAAGAGHIAGLTLWTTTTSSSYPIIAASTLALDTYDGTNQWDTAAAGVNIWDGQWHYAAISYSATSGQATAYIDGHSLGAKAPQPLNITAAPIMIGKWVDSLINQPLIGSVDEIAVYPTALSAARIAAHYAAAAAAAGAPPPPGMHSSATQIICNYEIASSQDTCTASVGDPSLTPTSPTGTVKFSSANGGSFPFGSTCTLVVNPTSGALTSCSVQFIPLNFPAVFPRLSAAYAGDATHTPSSGATFFGGLGKQNETAPPKTSVKQEAEAISIEVDVPVAETAVTACALSGGAGASAAGLIGSITKEIAAATEPLTRDVNRTAGGAISSAMAGALNGELLDVSGGLGQLQQSLGSPFSSPAAPLSLPALEAALKTLVEREKAQPVDAELRAALKQVEADQADVSKLLQNMQSQCKAAAGAIGSSVMASVAKKHAKHGRALASVRRRNVPAGRLHLKLRLSSAKLKKLAKGKKHLTLTVPVNMVLPSKRFSHGFPLLSVQHVTLDLSKHKKKKKKK